MVPFGGWDMPLEYPRHDRRAPGLPPAAVVFDVSHLGTVRVEGPDAFERLQRALHQRPRARSRRAGPSTPTCSTRPTRSVLDDIIVWWHPETTESRVRRDAERLQHRPRASARSAGRDDHRTTGPCSPSRARAPEARWRRSGRRPPRSAASASPTATWDGVAVHRGRHRLHRRGRRRDRRARRRRRRRCGTAHRRRRRRAGRARRPRHAAARGRPAAARSRARPRHHAAAGRAGLGGRAGTRRTSGVAHALVAERERGIDRRLVGIATEGRRPPRAGCAVLVDGAAVGEVTIAATSRRCSATASRSRSCRPTVEVGDEVAIDVRGNRVPGQVVATPFVGR